MLIEIFIFRVLGQPPSGVFPTWNNVADAEAAGVRGDGHYGDITSAIKDPIDDGAGIIVYTLDLVKINKNIQGETVTYSLSSGGVWICFSTLATDYAPKECL